MSYEPKVKVKANETILPNSNKIVEIYPVTEGLRAPSTKDLYRNRFSDGYHEGRWNPSFTTPDYNRQSPCSYKR
jgi:hypothetical protein